MIEKQELLEAIDEAIRTEERAVPLYMRHISASIPWFGFSDGERELIVNTLKGIMEDSKGHKERLERIRQSILEDERHVY